MKIRSFIFDIILILLSVSHNIIFFLLLPIFLFIDLIFRIFGKKFNIIKLIADKWAKFWSIIVMFLLKIICNITYEIRGKNNIPKDNVIVISKHQSMWETIIMHLIFHRPVYIFKKELLRIPFYGWYLKFMSGIYIDRNGGSKSLKQMVKIAKKYIENNQNIIIFPQGTRTKIDAKIKDYPYQPGALGLYSFLKIPILPVALNSGIYWNKNGKKSGKIIIEFLPIIEAGLNKADFLELLQNRIENKSKDLAIISNE